MTLKNYTSELSRNAKAFSVESLLTATVNSAAVEMKFGKKSDSYSNLQTRRGITAELCYSDLWERFNQFTTEMIITKAGRRMFPTLKVRFHGLKFTATYIVYMDMNPVDETKYRYNFQRSEWSVAGPSNKYLSNSIYIHPSSPASGEIWMSQENISFDKVKLTNHQNPVMMNQIPLHSMHKYQPRIHILEMITDTTETNAANILQYIQMHSDRSTTFSFEQCKFVTVTAYQNPRITNLKIQSNPFAKGFRKISNATKGCNLSFNVIGNSQSI